MKFFIDTANIDEIKKGVEMGMVDGMIVKVNLLPKQRVDNLSFITSDKELEQKILSKRKKKRLLLLPDIKIQKLLSNQHSNRNQ